MSISAQISRLETAKNDLKTEIAKLDVVIPDETKLDEYHTYLNTYIVDFNSRLATLEGKMQNAIYFANQGALAQATTVAEKLAYYEAKQEDIIYLKGD